MTTTPTHITRPREVDTEAAKDDSQLRQKQMISGHFDKLATAKEDGPYDWHRCVGARWPDGSVRFAPRVRGCLLHFSRHSPQRAA